MNSLNGLTWNTEMNLREIKYECLEYIHMEHAGISATLVKTSNNFLVL